MTHKHINYKPVEKGGIGAELVHFFLREHADKNESGQYVARTLHDFLDNCPRRHREQHEYLGLILRIHCYGLIKDGLLFSVGFDETQDLPYSEKFFSYAFFKHFADYGSYDFSALGFQEVRRHFENSVIRLGIIKDDEESEMSATAFLIDKNRLVTALHCVENNYTISISEWKSKVSKLNSIKCLGQFRTDRPCVLARGTLDLAILEFESDPFPDVPKFGLWGAEILEECLVMGYPNMIGFDIGVVAGTGQIINEHKSSARNQELIIVDAKVKGGNSGGPVINRLGKVTGVITNALADEKNENELDKLGYGLATPAKAVADLLEKIDEEAEDVFEITFDLQEDVIKVKR